MNRAYGLIAITATAIALAGCASTGSTTAPKAAATRSAASSAPSAAPSATLTPWEDWCLGDGSTYLQDVVTDIGQIKVDVGNGQMGTATQDGQKLVQDAQSAQQNPPPEDAAGQAQYIRYMKDAERAGNQFYQGSVDGALPWISKMAGVKAAAQRASNKCNAVMGS